MVYDMERVYSHTRMVTFIQDGGDSVRKMEQEHINSQQMG